MLASMARTEVTTPDGVRIVRYTGYVPSFDGLPLDVDVTAPACGNEPCAPRPLVAFFHGWALDKKIGFRGGLYEGVQASDADPGLNPSKSPMFSGLMSTCITF